MQTLERSGDSSIWQANRVACLDAVQLRQELVCYKRSIHVAESAFPCTERRTVCEAVSPPLGSFTQIPLLPLHLPEQQSPLSVQLSPTPEQFPPPPPPLVLHWTTDLEQSQVPVPAL
ncbi:MAG TPA: hypothetical protein PKE62_13710 [Anaerolineales bacterium]|nr:hypothetical protein [Anaerolineales bacterium]